MRALSALTLLVFPLSCAHGGPAAVAKDPRSEASCAAFSIVVLGAAGGIDESNLSAYLLAPCGSSVFVALDAGTLFAGIRAAAASGAFADLSLPPDSGLTFEGWVLRDRIRAVLISHAHLDHFAGLVLDSPDAATKEAPKPILGLPTTLQRIRDHLFNGEIWANFTQEGRQPALATHPMVALEPGRAVPIQGTELTVEAWPLAHAKDSSTAFLLGRGRDRAIYVGDTGPDAVQNSDALAQLWRRIAPLIRAHELKVLMIETSWPDGQDDAMLFGHLTPAWLMTELHHLAEAVDPASPSAALAGFPVMVTHIKPSLRSGPTANQRIERELTARNDLGVRFIFPRQGQRLGF